MNTKFPKISVITPSYNQGSYLEETILSIIDQQYPNLEFIIIDGGSTDNSIEIIRKYERYITYWISERDRGTYDANNKGLALFTGDYWCVVNSDDMLKAGSLFKIADYLVNNNYPDWVTADIEYIDEHSNRLGFAKPEFPAKIAGYYFTTGCWIHHPVTFLSKKLFQNVGFFAESDIMDYDYWIRSEKNGFLPEIIHEELGSLRYHEDCKSMNFSMIHRQVIGLLVDYKSNLTKQKDIHELDTFINYCTINLLQNETKFYLYNKRYWKAAKHFMYIIFNNPSELKKRWPYGMMRRFFIGVKIAEFSPKAFVTNI